MLVPKTYPLLKNAIHEGAKYGYRRAHKHTETPSEFEVRSAVEDAVMYHIAEAFDFIDQKNNEL